MSDGQSEACAANGPFRRPSDTIDNAELTDFLRRVSTLGGMVQCRMAADRIEQQAARIAELEDALHQIVEHQQTVAEKSLCEKFAVWRVASRALKQQESEGK